MRKALGRSVRTHAERAYNHAILLAAFQAIYLIYQAALMHLEEWKSMSFILTTERLGLRQVHMLDHEPMYRIFGDATVMRFGDGVQTRQWVGNWIARCLAQYYQQWGFGPYAVVERKHFEVIGYCGLFYFPDINGHAEVEIGYRFVRTAWGYGYATEAATAVRDFAFQTLCLNRLIAMIDPHNHASIRVAEKLGMVYEGEVMFEGYDHPDHLYTVTVVKPDTNGEDVPVP